MKEIRSIVKAYQNYSDSDAQLALASVVSVEGSSYRRIGARMLVSSDGTWTGGISGGCLEGDALKKAHLAMNKNRASIVLYDTTEEDSQEIGVGLGCNGKIEVLFQPLTSQHGQNEMQVLQSLVDTRIPKAICKVILKKDDSAFDLGEIIGEDQIKSQSFKDKLDEAYEQQRTLHWQSETETILIEIIRPNIRLLIFGDNYDIYPLANAAGELGWEIEVYGLLRKIRKLFAFPVNLKPREHLTAKTPDAYTAIVLMSHDFAADKRIIPEFSKSPPAYLGMLGPRKRWDRMVNELNEEGHNLSDAVVDAVHNPIGLDIGAEVPEEIAVSICSEIIAHFRKRKGSFLKLRVGPIH